MVKCLWLGRVRIESGEDVRSHGKVLYAKELTFILRAVRNHGWFLGSVLI